METEETGETGETGLAPCANILTHGVAFQDGIWPRTPRRGCQRL